MLFMQRKKVVAMTASSSDHAFLTLKSFPNEKGAELPETWQANSITKCALVSICLSTALHGPKASV